MAGAPRFKIYTASGEYTAATKHPEEAACLVSFLGDGATIRDGHTLRWTVWTEGADGCAADSYDATADTIWRRVAANGGPTV